MGHEDSRACHSAPGGVHAVALKRLPNHAYVKHRPHLESVPIHANYEVESWYLRVQRGLLHLFLLALVRPDGRVLLEADSDSLAIPDEDLLSGAHPGVCEIGIRLSRLLHLHLLLSVNVLSNLPLNLIGSLLLLGGHALAGSTACGLNVAQHAEVVGSIHLCFS